MSDVQKRVVRHRVEHDKATGLSMNVYSWTEGDIVKELWELANRPVPGSGPYPFSVYLWDETIDGAIAEVRRAAMELAPTTKQEEAPQHGHKANTSTGRRED